MLADRIRRKPGLKLFELFMIIFTLVYCFPFYLIVSTSMKTPPEILMSTLALPKTFHLQNYIDAWEASNFPHVQLNTMIVSLTSVIGIILIASMASFTIAKQANGLNRFLYYFFLSGVMIPVYTVLVPLLQLLNNLRLMDAMPGLILVYIGQGMPFAVFLTVGFIRGFPKEIMEAGTIDGCSVYDLFWKIVLPSLKPIMASLFILDLIWIWNDFLLPVLVLQNSEHFTITLSQYAFYGEYGTKWNIAFAGYMMAIIPLALIYAGLQKFVVKGISAGALKG
ncbi:carbohydrate ABC transporter permease [Paenibacillus humicola]|uniref:carbohydrate ABC transporter permease n=1 Tax=Paenibacillus humicola TaxID=3110540 RepID=UPI00237B1304|nr:carbohydrate ABC transporter permease [Paenibacillus humicola]